MKKLHQRITDYLKNKPDTLGYLEYVHDNSNNTKDIHNFMDKIMDAHKRAIWKQQRRIGERIEHMLKSDENTYFITLTFDDEHLPKPDNNIQGIYEEQDTANLVMQFIKDNHFTHAVGNSDYGKKHGRFHWHVVAQGTKDVVRTTWKQGAVNFKRIPKTSVPLKLSRYIIKLKRHATKVIDPMTIYYPREYRKRK